MSRDATAIIGGMWIIAGALFGAADKAIPSAACFACAAFTFLYIVGVKRR